MSYRDLEKKTGITASTLQRYESGYISKLPIDKLYLIAKGLKVEPEYLMGWAEEEKTDRYKVDTSMLTEAELAEFNKVTGVNKQLFFEDLDEEHDMAIFKQAIVEILLNKRKERKR